MTLSSEQIASTQGQSQQYFSMPSASQDNPDDLSRVPSSLLGEHVPLSAIVPHFHQSQSMPLSTGNPNGYSINIYGGTGGSGGSGNGQGGQGGSGQGPVFYNMSTSELQIEAAIRILYQASAMEASHDSGESYGRPPCHRDTRQEYLDRLHAWSCATDDSMPLWMCGLAGTGKSAIAQSFCKELHARGCLGGGFFFKRGHPSRENAHKLFPTLAYQLAIVCPQFKAALAPRVANDPALVGTSLSDQLQKLILEPYHDAASNHPLVMVIDGLDECEGEDLQQQIMCCAMEAHSSRLRFLVVSRPESHIEAVVPPTSFDQLVVEASFPEVRRYLVDEFQRIRTTHEAMLAVNHPWPDYAVINTLVKKSSGHFIYAATVIRFIEDRDWNPIERLNIVAGIGKPDPDSGSPFAALDQLYNQILKAVPSQSRLRRILAVASARDEMSRDQGSLFSIDDIAQILQIKSTNIRLTLSRLGSVISLPGTYSNQGLFIWRHASFPDFLNNPERAGEFYLNNVARSSLAVSVIKAFCDSQCSPPCFEGTVPHITERLKFNFITTTKLSSDMAKSLDCVNLDSIFGWGVTNHRAETQAVLNWLKFHDAPRKLIQRWEDIVYMTRFDFYFMTHYSFTDIPHEMQSDEPHYINDISPQLLDIIQAYILFEFDGPQSYHLRNIRWVLNISWPEMLGSIATLRRSAGEDLNQNTMKLIVNAVKLYRIQDPPPEATLEVLAKRFLLLLALGDNLWVLRFSRSWSCILRSCPRTERFLDALRLLVMDTCFCDVLQYDYEAYRHIYHTLRKGKELHLSA
ncbi:hypothetical protein R3P38DRAFT_726811 [Favolaschia claudopus]|uniref:Nephrocystin 3-like N-terminal domain-containing protein n=1 Tax=Favolaschia claudopus TaxID=2862362 RepID=A0AAW0C463_9AGAR